MKLEINKDKLRNAVSKADKIAARNATLPALACILLDADVDTLTIKATNIDISLSVQIKSRKSGSKDRILVPADVLGSFLSNLPKNDSGVTLETKGNTLHVTSDSTDTTINTQPIDDFPEISDAISAKEFQIPAVDLIKGLNSVWYSAAVSSIKPELSSVYIHPVENDLVFVATDSFRLAEKKISDQNSGEFESVLIPYKNVVEIARIFDDIDEVVKVFFKEDQLVIKSEYITVISRVIDGNFPDYHQIIPKDKTSEVTILKEDLAQGLKLSNIFSDNFNQVVFSIMPSDGIFEITSNSKDVGETKNKIKAKMEGENIKISFNSRYITDSFNSIKSDSIKLKFNGADRPMIIQGADDNSFLYLVMPMNK